MPRKPRQEPRTRKTHHAQRHRSWGHPPEPVRIRPGNLVVPEFHLCIRACGAFVPVEPTGYAGDNGQACRTKNGKKPENQKARSYSPARAGTNSTPKPTASATNGPLKPQQVIPTVPLEVQQVLPKEFSCIGAWRTANLTLLLLESNLILRPVSIYRLASSFVALC